MNGILVALEYHGGISRQSWETVAAGQRISGETDQPLFLSVVAADDLLVREELAHRESARAIIVQHELLGAYTAEGYTLALEQLIRTLDPAIVLFPHSYQARDYAPRVAARFKQMLIADAVGFRLDGGLAWVRQLMQGKLHADYTHAGDSLCFVSFQSGAFRTEDVVSGTAEIEVFRPYLSESQIQSKPEEPFRAAAQGVDLTSAPLIVSVGRGIKEKDNLPIVEELAQALGAQLAASRPICDNGWLPMDRQVGSSGQTVSPKLYLAVGISGAIQHLVGMKGSKSIIAINKDENAPIFDVADYGIVGDLFEIVPALTAAVHKLKSA